MRIDLNLQRGDRQRDFLDNLNSTIRALTSSSSGSAGLSPDGLFRSTSTGPFPIDTAHVPITWQYVKDRDGALLYLDVTCGDPTVPEARWTTATHEVVTSVLAAALSERRRPFLRRNLFSYIGTQLDGEYWLPGYRFAPILPEDPQPHLINAERVVTIDMIVSAVDEQNAYAVAGEATRRHAARLSLLLNVGLMHPVHEHRWVLPPGENGTPALESVRYQASFNHPSVGLSEMPRKGELCPLGQYNGSLTARYRSSAELLSLPPQARRILRGIDAASPVVADAFDRGARLYQVGSVVQRLYPSVGLAYRVAAVEAIARADPSAPTFGEFMRRYVASRTGVDNLVEYMYGSVRSAHFHAGEFPLGEFSRVAFFDPLMDPEDAELTMIHFACFELTREAIVNWMVSLVPGGETPDDETPDGGEEPASGSGSPVSVDAAAAPPQEP